MQIKLCRYLVMLSLEGVSPQVEGSLKPSVLSSSEARFAEGQYSDILRGPRLSPCSVALTRPQARMRSETDPPGQLDQLN